MKRTMLFLLGAAGAMALLASEACSSKDDTGATTTTATGSGGCDCYPCGNYIIACAVGCPAGDPREAVCPGSLDTMVELNDCICDPARGNCASECAGTCSMNLGGAGGTGGSGATGGGGGTVSGGGTGGTDSGAGGDSATCMTCQGNAASGVCGPLFAACVALKTCG